MSVQITQEDVMVLVTFAAVLAGKISLEPQQQQELEKMIKSLKGDARKIADALQGKPAPAHCEEFAREIQEYVQTQEF